MGCLGALRNGSRQVGGHERWNIVHREKGVADATLFVDVTLVVRIQASDTADPPHLT